MCIGSVMIWAQPPTTLYAYVCAYTLNLRERAGGSRCGSQESSHQTNSGWRASQGSSVVRREKRRRSFSATRCNALQGPVRASHVLLQGPGHIRASIPVITVQLGIVAAIKWLHASGRFPKLCGHSAAEGHVSPARFALYSVLSVHFLTLEFWLFRHKGGRMAPRDGKMPRGKKLGNRNSA